MCCGAAPCAYSSTTERRSPPPSTGRSGFRSSGFVGKWYLASVPIVGYWLRCQENVRTKKSYATTRT